MSEDLLKIINHYGVNNQLRKFNEECYELIEAIRNYEDIEPFSNEDTNFKAIFKNHVTEEIADVCVMLLQFKEYYHIYGNDILRIMNEKIDRQLNRIKEEK